MLVAQHVAFQMIELAKPIVDATARHDRSLADQMRRAAQSSVLNIAEGACSRGGNETVRFSTALGSTNETRAAIHVAVAWLYLPSSKAQPCLDALDHLSRLLWGLVHRKKSL